MSSNVRMGSSFGNFYFRRIILDSKLINALVPGSIPTKLIKDTSNPRRRYFQMLENQSLVVKAAKKINCHLINIAPSDLVEGKVT